MFLKKKGATLYALLHAATLLPLYGLAQENSSLALRMSKLDGFSTADLSIEERISLLESKLQAQEKAINEKLSDCVLQYQRLGRRATWCPEGAVVTEVEKIYGTELLNVTCARPVLRCSKLGISIPVENAR